MDEPYNPYALLTFVIEGEKMAGRPYEFDSEVVNFDEMKNSKGKYIKPVKASTLCPKCGQGLMIDLDLPDPPFADIHILCEYCKVTAPFDNPFINPISSNRISILELDPAAQPHTELFNAGQSVAERHKLPGDFSGLSDLEKFKLNIKMLPQEIFGGEAKELVKELMKDPVKKPVELVEQEIIRPVVNTGLVLESQKRVLPAADIGEEREIIDDVRGGQGLESLEEDV